MAQRITFVRTQIVTIQFSDQNDNSPDARPNTRSHWNRWANHVFGDACAIDMMLAGTVPADNIVQCNKGRWDAILADPEFAPDA